jgi:capsular polysaccharide biosynthesis protein
MRTIVGHNVFLTRSGIGMKAFRLIDETIHRYPGKRRHFWQYALLQFFVRGKITLRGKYFVVHNHWCPGYYHWITEALVRLLSVRDQVKDRILVLPESFKESLAPSLAPLYNGKIFWVPENKNLLIEDLLIPENPFSGQYDPGALKLLRDIYIQHVVQSGEHALRNRRLYVSRRKAARRKVYNEDELEQMLKNYDFEVVNYEDFTFWEQVRLSMHCSMLISIHGAGLSNVLFMSAGMHVVELQHQPMPGFKKDVLYRDLCEIMNLKYDVLFCEPSGVDQSLPTGDIVVDLEAIKKIVSNAVREIP